MAQILRRGSYKLLGHITLPGNLDPGLKYLRNGQKMRMWYGEDLYNFYEYDNRGYTCMNVYVRSVQVDKGSNTLEERMS